MTVKLYNDSIRQITCYKDQAHVNNYKYFLNTYNLPLQLNLLPISRKAVYLTLTKIQNTLLSTRARRVVAPSCLVYMKRGKKHVAAKQLTFADLRNHVLCTTTQPTPIYRIACNKINKLNMLQPIYPLCRPGFVRTPYRRRGEARLFI